jgi:hypothetical protein
MFAFLAPAVPNVNRKRNKKDQSTRGAAYFGFKPITAETNLTWNWEWNSAI